MHRSRFAGLIIDCNTDDLEAAASFWSAALGVPPRADVEPAYISLDMPAGEPHVEVQKVDHRAGSTWTSKPTTSRRKSPASKRWARGRLPTSGTGA